MSPVPSVTFRSELPPIVRKELDQLDSELTDYLLKEHNDDGEHTHITAKSITVIGGPVTINGQPITGAAVAPAAHHATHEPGGSDAILNAAWTNLANTFAPLQTFTAGATATGPISTNNNVNAGGYVQTTAGLYERNRSTMLGEWINVAYAAANFGGSGAMTWTVEAADQLTYAYTLVGRTAHIVFQFNSTSVGGTPNTYLTLKLPAGLLPAKSMEALSYANDGGPFTLTRIRIFSGDGTLLIMRTDAANWAVAANTTNVMGQFVLPI